MNELTTAERNGRAVGFLVEAWREFVQDYGDLYELTGPDTPRQMLKTFAEFFGGLVNAQSYGSELDTPRLAEHK